MSKELSLKKYEYLAFVTRSCENTRVALVTLKKMYDFSPRIVGRINKAIEAMDIIVTVLCGLINIEEQEILSPTKSQETKP